jgi:hypothetical protein
MMTKIKFEDHPKPNALPQFAVFVTLGSFLLGALALVLISTSYVAAQVVQILIVIAGMLTASGVNNSQELFQTLMSKRNNKVSFPSDNELSQLLPEAEEKAGTTSNAHIREEARRLTEILAIDPNAALARLRMDIEADLRELAKANHADLSHRPLSAKQLISILREHLDANLQLLLEEILQACNRAIHGYTIDQETAARVINAGIMSRNHLADSKRKLIV